MYVCQSADACAWAIWVGHAHSAYKVHDLRDYRSLYTIDHDDIKEIKISPGVMLVIHEQQTHHVLLKILNMYARHVGILPTPIGRYQGRTRASEGHTR